MVETIAECGINSFKRQVHLTAVEHGWWENGERNMGELIALMHSELSEALECWRNGEPRLWYDYGDGVILTTDTMAVNPPPKIDGKPKPCGLASEFADVIIRIFDACEHMNIPITQALIEKAAYNETRPYRHGGKLA